MHIYFSRKFFLKNIFRKNPYKKEVITVILVNTSFKSYLNFKFGISDLKKII